MPKSLPLLRLATLGAALALGPLALAGCGGAGTELPTASYGSEPIAPSEQYTIGPLDEITIHVWRNPELSADKVRVRVLKMSVSGAAARFLAPAGAEKVPAAEAEKKAS